MNKFETFRRQVPAVHGQVYLETGATGLIPDFVHDAVRQYQEDRYLKGGNSLWECGGDKSLSSWDMIDWSRESIAEMIGTVKENIVFGLNSSQIYTLFSSGMEFNAGDNIILPEGGWMGNRYAWQIREKEGLELRYAKPHEGKLEPEDIFALCDQRTKAVCLPLVEPETGFAIDAGKIGAYCWSKGIWFALDGVQGLGVLPVDVEKMKIDLLTGNDYKWMMNYGGTGYGYISPALRGALDQRAASWMGCDFRQGDERLLLKEGAGRFEFGFPTVSSIYGVGLVARKYTQMGGQDIRDYIFGLTEELHEGLGNIEGVRSLYDFPRKNWSGITILLFEPDTGLTNEKLAAANIAATLKPFDNEGRQTMRVCFHYYNNLEDVHRLLEVIGKKGA